MINPRWDVANALAELDEVLPTKYEDYGEGIILEFRQMGVYAFRGGEGMGGFYYEVKPVPA